MSGLHDSSVDPPPRPRGCCRAFASALCKIAKVLLHLGILLIIFILIFLGLNYEYSFGAKIILESVSYPAIACLYIYTSSTRKERMISGTFLGVLAVVIVIAAPSAKGRRTSHVPIFVCNFLALLAYCVWRFWALLQACLRRVRRSAAAPPLLPVVVQQEEGEVEAGCSSSPVVQHAAFRIEDLPREFSHDELVAVTGDFGSRVGRGGSGEVFHGVLDDGAAVAVKRIIGNMAVGEADFLREISIVANVHHRSLVRLLGYCLLRDGEGQQQQQYLLVYPFFEHGSLDWWLFHGERRRVAADVARALAYLHHECHRQILHLDIKPANILLDGGLRAHVSDFASPCPSRGTAPAWTRAAGAPPGTWHRRFGPARCPPSPTCTATASRCSSSSPAAAASERSRLRRTCSSRPSCGRRRRVGRSWRWWTRPWRTSTRWRWRRW
ncbi:hypothetical protein PR202_gb05363 [Eleusine coracana subsp. coracana]|uniref:Protein kinase domain-containing protein n=1 Tax=Eleusine coracana subsp. coracana TaxID=191504 RepID=A0AAV5E4A7_ELECO|nr:hypothetical protein PR202_gb05363 [Eleusine coracana subsp. coracana]